MVDWLTKLTRKPTNTRREERTVTSLPVRVENKQAGFTRDMSASGAYFETDLEYKIGSAIEFAIEFQGADGSVTNLACVGRIVRVEPRGAGRVGVAVKISQRTLKAGR
jgi:hypothetical protein